MVMPRNTNPAKEKCSKPLYIRIEPQLKLRLQMQCARLGITESGLTKMALTKFIEEEEQIEADKMYRRK